MRVNYNPDVLSCLANLSNDEVFTPPGLVNKMLDMLPPELFQNKESTFLDPTTKSGVFLREIAKRLNEGLKEQIPDPQERINHILGKQLYGIAITELTSLLSRRSVYCTKKANGEYSICTTFSTEEGNIKYDKIEHTWKDPLDEQSKCIYCGAKRKKYQRGDDLETYAYQFIHTNTPKDIFTMKFDVIIGNPPYQLSDGSGGSTDAAMPIYQKFVEQAQKLEPRYLVMIIPSKWMVGGRGLDKFRNKMFADKRIKKMFDFEDASECFPGIHLDGGACYFLWDKTYSGAIEYTYKTKDGEELVETRKLGNKYFKFAIRDNRVANLMKKIDEKNVSKFFSSIVSSTKPFGIRKDLFNNPTKYPTSGLKFKEFQDSIRIFGVQGLKGGAKRKIGYVHRTFVEEYNTGKIPGPIDTYKLFFTTTYSTGAVQYPEVIKGGPNDVCTETFLVIGPFTTEEERDNCLQYMETKFFKALLFFGKGTMQVTQTVFSLIPLLDWKKKWTDEQLYKEFDLQPQQIAFIERLFQ